MDKTHGRKERGLSDNLKKEIFLIALEECLAYVFEVISDHPNYQGICKGLNLDGIKWVVKPFISEEASKHSVSDLEKWLDSPRDTFVMFLDYVEARKAKGPFT